MIGNMFDKILALFGKQKLNTNDLESIETEKYTNNYEDNKSINFTAIFANKLTNFVINDSSINLDGEDKRTELLNDVLKRMWKKSKKIIARSLGTGGVVVIPFVNRNKIYFDVITQDRLSINKQIGEDIIDCTIMAEHLVRNQRNYYRWADYTLENNNLYIRYRATMETSPVSLEIIPEWGDIEDISITNVIKMPFMFLKSPVDNRRDVDNYGVPITYGCEKEINEIKDTLKQIIREYDLKEAFVGADSSMFKGDGALPSNGLYKKINSGEDNFWEVFDPAIRDSSLFNKLMNQCAMLEKQIGTSRGILTDPLSTYQNTQETRRALYDTFSIIDDIRESLNDGINDFLYGCDVLANYYNLSPMGTYQLVTDWSYGFIEDDTVAWNQMVQGKNQGVISKVELRQFLKPDESLEEAQKIIDEIKAEEPTTKDLLGE
jgi:hypothetical protein